MSKNALIVVCLILVMVVRKRERGKERSRARDKESKDHNVDDKYANYLKIVVVERYMPEKLVVL